MCYTPTRTPTPTATRTPTPTYTFTSGARLIPPPHPRTLLARELLEQGLIDGPLCARIEALIARG
jgi:hypothetical protein